MSGRERVMIWPLNHRWAVCVPGDGIRNHPHLGKLDILYTFRSHDDAQDWVDSLRKSGGTGLSIVPINRADVG